MGFQQRFRNAIRLFTDKDFRFLYLVGKGFYKSMPDEEYLKRFYHAKMGKTLDLEHPRTFNEKLQWLKLHDRNPRYQQLVDKIAVKEYIAECLSEEYVIPTLGVWKHFDDIDFDRLPDQFVLKCSHDSGGLVICTDKAKLDKAAAKEKIERSLRRNYYTFGREWPYNGIEPRILAEKYMCDGDHDKENLTDYKIFCFAGEPRYVMTVRDRSKGKGHSLHRWYDTDWQLQDLDLDYRGETRQPEERPAQLDEMLRIARQLAKGIRHVRVDLYLIGGRIYFGEMTFYHQSGAEYFEPEEWDEKLGALIPLDEVE